MTLRFVLLSTFLLGAKAVNLRMSSSFRGRSLQSCILPTQEMSCAVFDDQTIACGGCCWYDIKDPTITVESTEGLANKDAFENQCFSKGQNENRKCYCGSLAASRVVTDAPTVAPTNSTASSRVVTDAPSSTPTLSNSTLAPTNGNQTAFPTSFSTNATLTPTTNMPTQLSSTQPASGRVDCLNEGATVAPDVSEVCDYRSCCSQYCGCLTTGSATSCRCSAAP